MKVIAALLLLFAVSCSADILTRQMKNTNCNDAAALSYINDGGHRAELCDDIDVTPAETCGDDCLGVACTYYTNNGYTTLCNTIIAIGCFTGSSGSGNVSTACERCFDSRVLAVYLDLPASCNVDFFRPQDVCNDECLGASCTFYMDNGYPDDCRTDLAQFCTDAGQNAPAVCESEPGTTGALALVTMKGVAAVTLLVTAFFVF